MSRKSRLDVPAVVCCGLLGFSAAAFAKASPCGPPLSDFAKPPSVASDDSAQAEPDDAHSATDTYLAAQGYTGGRNPASASRSIAKASDDSDTGGDDEYNFSWLDPDKKVYVLQNRKYRKKGRLAIYLSGGMNLSNPYETEYEVVPRAGYWLSEQFGLEVFYSAIRNTDNSTLVALQNVSASALPYVRQNTAYYGAVVQWAPWYAKLNFFNKILYFDWAINAGGGQTATSVNQNNKAGTTPNYVQQNLATIFYGTDMMFYLTHNFLIRFDLIGMMYNATGPDNVTTQYIQNYEFTAGIGWAF